MKKLLPITIIALLVTTSPVFAVSDKANEKATNNPSQEVLSDLPRPTEIPPVVTPTPNNANAVGPTVTPTAIPTHAHANEKVLGKKTQQPQLSAEEHEECDPNAEYKNHGEYVSCVAKLGLGGQVVSAAARSDVGKKSITPTGTATPTATLTPSPTEPVTPPITSAEAAIGSFNPLQSLGSLFNRFVGFFKNLV